MILMVDIDKDRRGEETRKIINKILGKKERVRSDVKEKERKR